MIGGDTHGLPHDSDASGAFAGGTGVSQCLHGVFIDQPSSHHQVPCDELGVGPIQSVQIPPDGHVQFVSGDLLGDRRAFAPGAAKIVGPRAASALPRSTAALRSATALTARAQVRPAVTCASTAPVVAAAFVARAASPVSVRRTVVPAISPVVSVAVRAGSTCSAAGTVLPPAGLTVVIAPRSWLALGIGPSVVSVPS